MSNQWESIEVIPGLGVLKPALDTIKGIATAVKTALIPIQAIIDVLKPIVGALSAEQLFIGLDFQFLVNLLAVHLYPAQAYQAMRLEDWATSVQYSFALSETCSEVTEYQLIVLAISAPGAEIVKQATQLQAIFGQSSSMLEEDVPDSTDSHRKYRMLSRPTKCTTLLDEVPIIGDILEFLNSNATLSVDNPISGLANALALKLEVLSDLISEVDDLLDAMDTLNVPGVWALSTPVSSIEEVAGTIISAMGGPELTDYVAGSAFLMARPSGSIVSSFFNISSNGISMDLKTPQEVQQILNARRPGDSVEE